MPCSLIGSIPTFQQCPVGTVHGCGQLFPFPYYAIYLNTFTSRCLMLLALVRQTHALVFMHVLVAIVYQESLVKRYWVCSDHRRLLHKCAWVQCNHVMQAKTTGNIDAMLIEKDRELHTNRPLLFDVLRVCVPWDMYSDTDCGGHAQETAEQNYILLL